MLKLFVLPNYIRLYFNFELPFL